MPERTAALSFKFAHYRNEGGRQYGIKLLARLILHLSDGLIECQSRAKASTKHHRIEAVTERYHPCNPGYLVTSQPTWISLPVKPFMMMANAGDCQLEVSFTESLEEARAELRMLAHQLPLFFRQRACLQLEVVGDHALSKIMQPARHFRLVTILLFGP